MRSEEGRGGWGRGGPRWEEVQDGGGCGGHTKGVACVLFCSNGSFMIHQNL